MAKNVNDLRPARFWRTTAEGSDEMAAARRLHAALGTKTEEWDQDR